VQARKAKHWRICNRILKFTANLTSHQNQISWKLTWIQQKSTVYFSRRLLPEWLPAHWYSSWDSMQNTMLPALTSHTRPWASSEEHQEQPSCYVHVQCWHATYTPSVPTGAPEMLKHW
jgi:hypothetical protein